MWKILTALWGWIFLRESIKPDDRPARRYPEPGPDVDLPRFRDNYAERNSGETTQEIEEKVKTAIANLKVGGKF